MRFLERAIVMAALLLVAATGGSEGAERQHRPEKQTVTVKGTAVIDGGNVAAAEKAARADAMRKGIEQVIGAYVSGKAKAENGQLIDSLVTEKFGGFAQIVRVLSQKQDDGMYELQAEVAVSPVPMLEIMRKNGLMREWRVMVIIPEQHISTPVPDPAAETEFIRQFVNAGYKVIDQKRYAELRQQNAARLKDPAVAAEIGRKMGADIVITGEAFSQRVVPDVVPGMVSCRARVEVRAILADTAEIVAADATEGPGADLVESVSAKKALQNTAKKLAPLFVRDITLLPASESRNVQIEVSIFASFTKAARFERAVRSLPGVTKVSRESYDEGVLVLNVESDAESAEDFALVLEEAEAIKPYGLAVGAVSKTRIRATVKQE
ncbi:MAG TPA: hypothetical protein GX715_15315 [Armatimonadetes bacterium]|jgi:hypothetical protein|nr:hypothetical protein [Armatimonadota bacterium]